MNRDLSEVKSVLNKERQKMKKKVILTSILTIALCLSLIAGSTFALFTSESKVNIAVNAGKVEMIANVENIETWSLENDKTAAGRTDGTFTQGGTATFANGVLTLDKIIPGDKVAFDITGTNNSNVTIQYRVKIACTEGDLLMSALKVTIGNETVTGLSSYTSAWTTLAAETAMNTVDVAIELPAEAGNEYQDLTTKISVLVEAVQGNATVTNDEAGIVTFSIASTAEELSAAIAEGGLVVINDDITLNDAPITVPANEEVIIDLGGNKLTGISTSSTSSNLIKVPADATLTLKNGTVSFGATTPDTNWGGEGQPAYPGYANNTINCSGTLVIDGATVENLTAKGGASYAIDCYPGANLIINDGIVNGRDKIAIRTFANSGTTPINVTINGGKVSGYRAIWVQLPSSNETVAPNVNVTINGGTLVSTDTVYKQVLYVYSYGNSFDGTTINVMGGTIVGDIALGGGGKNGVKYGKETVNVDMANVTLYGSIYSYNDAAGFTEIDANATGTTVVTDATSLNQQIADANVDTVIVSEGNYTLPSVSGKDMTIVGSEDTVITVGKPNCSGSDVTFEGVTIKGSGYSTGVQHVNTVTYNGATIVGEMCLYGEKVVFNNCKFELAAGQYIWTYGAAEVEFNNCTFNTAGKAILIYNEGADADSKVTVNGCTFNATAGAKAGAIANQDCAAIEIDSTHGDSFTLITSGNTIDSDFSGEWRIKDVNTAVTVNGVEYTTLAVDGKTMTRDADKNVTVNG